MSLKQVNITSRQTAVVPDTYGLGGASMSNAGTAGTSAASGSHSSASGSPKDSGRDSQKKASLLYNVASNMGIF